MRLNIDGDESKILDFKEMLKGLKHLKNLEKLEKLEELEEIKNIEFFKNPHEIDIEVITKDKSEA